MKHFSMLIFALLLSCASFAQVVKFRDLPDDVDVSRRAFNEAVKEYEEEKERYDIVIPPIERVVSDVDVSVSSRSDNPVNIVSWGRNVLLPESIRQRVIDECGKYKVIIVTVDSGVDQLHPEYAWVKWLPASNYTGQPGKHWHGTHVAGITYQLIGEVADKYENIQMKDAQILTSSGSGSFAWAVNMAKTETSLFQDDAKNGTGVIFNNSWGADITDYAPLTAELKKSQQAGMIWIGAAGNSGRVTNGYPGQSAYLTGVASLDPNIKRSSYSTMNDSIDVAAPGSNILSTLPDGKQGSASGTSMASPFITGVAALAYGKYGKVLQGANMNTYLRHIATDITPVGRDNQTGWGITFLSTMLDTDPCTVAGIKCDGTQPEEPQDPEEPDTPTDPNTYYVKGELTGAYQMYWRRLSDKEMKVITIPSLTFSAVGQGGEAELYERISKELKDYFSNRGLVLMDNMDEWSATKWTARFAEIIAKNNGVLLQVDEIVGVDPVGNRYVAEQKDIKPSAKTLEIMTENADGLLIFGTAQLIHR